MVSQFPKKCADNCTPCPCDKFLKKIINTKKKRQDKKETEILHDSTLIEANDESKQIAFNDAATTTTQKSNDLYHLKISEFNHRTLTEFPINSYVLAHYGNDPHDRPPTKTHTANQGPFLVVDIDSTKTRYTVKDIVFNKLFDLHVSWLRPFIYEEGRTNPIDVALADSNEQEIEEVIQHFGNTSSLKKSHLTFTVRYRGQIIPDSKRLTWAQLRDTEALHKYLTQNNLRKYLNKRFTYPVNSPEWIAERAEIQNVKRSASSNTEPKQVRKRQRGRNKHKRAKK